MKTKYPILLVHGIVIKDWKFIKCFGNIKKMLNQAGFDVDNIGYSMLGNCICEFLGFHECVPESVRWCQIEFD